mgnify:CR=1 FL=1
MRLWYDDGLKWVVHPSAAASVWEADAAGAEVVVEEFLAGEEVSVFAICDGKTALVLASAQDHKAVYDGDKGPNTGGMGAYSPAPVMDDDLAARVEAEFIKPTMALESIPPDKKAPNGTSERNRNSTDRERASWIRANSSFRERPDGVADAAGSHQRPVSVSSPCNRIQWPAGNKLTPFTMVRGACAVW